MLNLIREKRQQIEQLEKEVVELQKQYKIEYNSKPNVGDIENLAKVYYFEKRINNKYNPLFIKRNFIDMINSAVKLGIIESDFGVNVKNFDNEKMIEIIVTIKKYIANINWDWSLYEIAQKLNIPNINSHMSKLLKCQIDPSSGSPHFTMVDSQLVEKQIICGWGFSEYNHFNINVVKEVEFYTILRKLLNLSDDEPFDESISFVICLPFNGDIKNFED